MAKKVIVLFVEGSTEIEFYKAVIKRAHDLMSAQFNTTVRYVDMCGIGNYKKDAVRKFRKLKGKYDKGTCFSAFLCYDSDVFKFAKRPPINRKEVRTALKNEGISKVIDIVADSSIEEWFLQDMLGVISYLKLPNKTKRPRGNGQEALTQLFKKGKKIYVKGGKTEGFINRLDIEKIMISCCESLSPLCKEVGFNCSVVCGKRKN